MEQSRSPWRRRPTAVATRLIDPARTSPTAKTPGRLVSRDSRMVPSGPAVTSRPVRTKPAWSRSTSSGSQEVRGTDPISTNRPPAGTSSVSPPCGVAEGQAHQAPVLAAAAEHGGAVAEGDVAGGLELGDEVVRHARRQRRAAHEEGDLPRVAGEVERRLPRRVAAARRRTRPPPPSTAPRRRRRRSRRRGRPATPAPGRRGGGSRRRWRSRRCGSRTRLPSAIETVRRSPSVPRDSTGRMKLYSVPKAHACWKDRKARWAPLTPREKPG